MRLAVGSSLARGLNTIFVHVQAFVHESVIRVLPPPLFAILLQYYCTTIVQCTTAPRPPFCLPYTI